jgi:type II secretory pathway pseudopilin PulG
MTGLISTLQTIALGLGVWAFVSVVAALAISIWFRARARANDLLALDERRRAYLEAATSERIARS